MDGAVPLRNQETHMSNFDNMGKEELRAACKAGAVKGWGKMNNTQMREALAAKQAEMGIPATIQQTEAPVAEVVKEAEQLPVEDSRKPVVEVPVEAPAAPAPAPVAAPKSKSAGTKIQKDREERNGVKRPSAGTICAHIWASLDAHLATYKTTPSFKDLKVLQDQNGWQRNTAVTQYQRWKEFNDLMVR
jgi:hypothetical protein